MKNLFFLAVILTAVHIYPQIPSGEINKILDNINFQSQRQEQLQKNLKNYKYKQFIHFIKMDGDDEIEEQSKREYHIYVKSDSVRKRELLSALIFEDGEWKNISEEEKANNKEKHSESKSFSLSEMVGPDNRKNYAFEIIGDEFIEPWETVHIRAKAIEEDEDRFQGDLWFEKENYSLVKAQLQPSEMPTFVDEMNMYFEMQQMDSLWFPQKIEFDAEVGILFLFSGKIHSEITFSEFEFDQQFNETWFNNLDNAE